MEETETVEPEALEVLDEIEQAQDREADDQEPAGEKRCEAETTVGGTLYRCALQAGHDDEHRFQPATDEEPELEQPPKDHSKRLKALENEAVRHANRIREIIGPDAEGLEQCALCPPNFAGWRFDIAPSEEQTAKVRAVIGLPDVSNFAASATERQCDDCRGLGRVRTGSSVQGRETTTCDACAGKGYVATRPRLNAAAPEPAPGEHANGTEPAPDDGIKRDVFGTPEGDPDYEKMPNARERPVSYWEQYRK